MTSTEIDILPAVWKLLGEYPRQVDGGHADEWSRLFAENGTLATGSREVTGREALREFAAASPRGVHVQGVPSVERREDGGVRSVSSFVFVNAESHQIIAGEYTDDLTDGEDGLVFLRRSVETRVRT